MKTIALFAWFGAAMLAPLAFPARPITSQSPAVIAIVGQELGSEARPTAEALLREMAAAHRNIAPTRQETIAGVDLAVSDFELDAVGEYGALALAGPGDSNPGLVGPIDVVEATPSFPIQFGQHAIIFHQPTTVYFTGGISGIGFSAAKYEDVPVDPPVVACTVVMDGDFVPSAFLLLTLPEPMPEFGNFGLLLSPPKGQSLLMGYCQFTVAPGVVVDNVVLLRE